MMPADTDSERAVKWLEANDRAKDDPRGYIINASGSGRRALARLISDVRREAREQAVQECLSWVEGSASVQDELTAEAQRLGMYRADDVASRCTACSGEGEQILYSHPGGWDETSPCKTCDGTGVTFRATTSPSDEAKPVDEGKPYREQSEEWRRGYDEAEHVYHRRQTDLRRELRKARHERDEALKATSGRPEAAPECTGCIESRGFIAGLRLALDAAKEELSELRADRSDKVPPGPCPDTFGIRHCGLRFGHAGEHEESPGGVRWTNLRVHGASSSETSQTDEEWGKNRIALTHEEYGDLLALAGVSPPRPGLWTAPDPLPGEEINAYWQRLCGLRQEADNAARERWRRRESPKRGVPCPLTPADPITIDDEHDIAEKTGADHIETRADNASDPLLVLARTFLMGVPEDRWGEELSADVAALLHQVRRETIEACAKDLRGLVRREGPHPADMGAAMAREDDANKARADNAAIASETAFFAGYAAGSADAAVDGKYDAEGALRDWRRTFPAMHEYAGAEVIVTCPDTLKQWRGERGVVVGTIDDTREVRVCFDRSESPEAHTAFCGVWFKADQVRVLRTYVERIASHGTSHKEEGKP